MLNTILGSLLPVVITFLLGIFAASRREFKMEHAIAFNRLVMHYTLPLALFVATLRMSPGQLSADVPLVIAIAGCMVLTFALAGLVAYYAFHRDLMTSTLQALAIGAPAVPFIGVTVLGYLFGTASAVPIAIAGITINLVQVPAVIILLSVGAAERENRRVSNSALWAHAGAACRHPVVWAPVLGIVLAFLRVPVPVVIRESLELLGRATGGVALFSAGVILYARRVKFSVPIAVSVLTRTVVIPGAMLLLFLWLGMPARIISEAVLTLAIPSASICIIFAVEFRAAEQEMASTLFFSNIVSLGTMSAFIWLTS